MHFSTQQQRFIHLLAELYPEQAGRYFTPRSIAEQIDISVEQCRPLVRMAHRRGLLTRIIPCDGDIGAFNISDRALKASQRIELAQARAAARWHIALRIKQWIPALWTWRHSIHIDGRIPAIRRAKRYNVASGRMHRVELE